jgi:diaminopimelate epimerase
VHSSHEIPFVKYTGAGNDFILIDYRLSLFPADRPALVKQLCHRQLGIGGDGLLLVGHGSRTPYCMRIFNADGSEAEMCGNGLRCVVQYLHEVGWGAAPYHIEVGGKLYEATISGGRITHSLPAPTQFGWSLPVDGVGELDWIDTGVPHVLLFVDQLEEIDVMGLGQTIRHHSRFAPRGTNVNFVAIDSDGDVRIRTYERGVESETLACGTGATAAALAVARRLGRSSGPIAIQVQSGERLIVNFEWAGSTVKNLTLTGPARRVFTGSVDINSEIG